MKRRSAARSTPRKKYTVDAFEGIEELQDARSDSQETGEDGEKHDESAEEFIASAQQSSEDDGEDDATSGAEAEPDRDDMNDDDSSSIVQMEDETGSPRINRTPSMQKKRNFRFDSTGTQTFIRGINEDQARGMSKEARRVHLFGSDERDFQHASNIKRKWALDPTLPSRVRDENDFGGTHRTFFLDEEMWVRAAKQSQAWWNQGGGKAVFTSRQHLQTLSEDEAVEYLGEHRTSKMSFLLGPFKDQQLHELAVGEGLRCQEAGKSAYMLNIGSKILSLDWAMQKGGQDQFLAVSTSRTSTDSRPRFQAAQAPAFTPQPPYKSNAQIWKFQRTQDGRLDSRAPPHLHTVLCCEWGDPIALRWYPVFHDDAHIKDSALLAGIWPDGALRVLNVPLSPGVTETQFLLVKSASFESRPPGTLCTCLTWISDTRLAAGCANGCIAVWDLTSVTNDTPTNVRPTIYSTVTNTYILSIASCSPSRPNLIVSSSMGGFIALSDLSRSAQSLASQASTVFNLRNRMGSPLVVWSDFMQTALHVDDNHLLRGSAIRRIFTSVGLARYKGTATCLATSLCHPFVLVGTSNGDVVSSNPIKRIMDGKANIWQQTLLNHEWKRPTPHAEDNAGQIDGEQDTEDARPNSTEAGATTVPNGSTGSPFRVGDHGLSRILQGFKAERCLLAPNERNALNQQNGVTFVTIHEDKTAITALAWNPNVEVGGWVAVGMGSGLVRIEDVAVDV